MQDEMEALIEEELNKVDYLKMLNEINANIGVIRLDISNSIKETYA